MILHGDCLEHLRSLEADSLDSLVTDPPAGISFMGKGWDSDKGGRDAWIAWLTDVMRECYRVLKPGAHGLVWAIPRTSHWTATALENAGFEVRDVVTHLFGSGFPKSLDVSKAIDKAAGAEREVVGRGKAGKSSIGQETRVVLGARPTVRDGSDFNITAPATEAARQWQGWGTALKPASEHWILIRKPLSERTVAANVLKHGTGGINIDGCRIESPDADLSAVQNCKTRQDGNTVTLNVPGHSQPTYNPQGRFPANLVLSCCGNDPHDDVISFDAAQACASLSAQPLRGLLDSLGGCQFYRDFYGELSRLVEEHGRAAFPSARDVLAFVDLFLHAQEHTQPHPEIARLSSLGDFLRFCIGSRTLSNTSFAQLYADQTQRDTLRTSYREASSARTSSTSSSSKAAADTPETTSSSEHISDRLRTLGFLNTYLASDLQRAFITHSCPVGMLDEQSGITKSGGTGGGGKTFHGAEYRTPKAKTVPPNEGGASRFFYVAKSSKSDRNRKVKP